MNIYLKTIISSFIILNSLFLIGQNADCDDLLVLEDTIYHSDEISGYGNVKEFDGNDLEDKKIFEKEANSIWYLITSPTTGIFTFDIVTENENDDWDFLLYKNGGNFCSQISNKTISPIRSNLSRSPITGLSVTATENFISAGINNNYSNALAVTAGEQYVLVVNNPKKAAGKHTLILHYPKKAKKTLPAALFKIKVKDSETKKAVNSFITISGLKDSTITITNQSEYQQKFSKKNYRLVIDVSAKGYMLFSEEHKISKKKIRYTAEILLEKIKKGETVSLNNIQFEGNKAVFLSSSESSLKVLLFFMEINPNVVIEVGGFVNGPQKKNSKSFKELSYIRAYAVKNYLINGGIAKERVDFKGYGNSKMLYPKPKSAYQEAANRRVEIKIISNEYHLGN